MIIINSNDNLLLATKSYNNLINKNFIIKIKKENNIRIIKVQFKKENFYHLIGLHYIKDIPKVDYRKNKKTTIFNNILNGKIKYTDIEKSALFNDKIKNRIDFFKEIDKLIFDGIIIDFDKNKLDFNSKLKGIYIFFKTKENTYLHLALGTKDIAKDILYPESFFVENNNKYIKNQDLYEILSITQEDITKRKKSSSKNKDDL